MKHPHSFFVLVLLFICFCSLEAVPVKCLRSARVLEVETDEIDVLDEEKIFNLSQIYDEDCQKKKVCQIDCSTIHKTCPQEKKILFLDLEPTIEQNANFKLAYNWACGTPWFTQDYGLKWNKLSRFYQKEVLIFLGKTRDAFAKSTIGKRTPAYRWDANFRHYVIGLVQHRPEGKDLLKLNEALFNFIGGMKILQNECRQKFMTKETYEKLFQKRFNEAKELLKTSDSAYMTRAVPFAEVWAKRDQFTDKSKYQKILDDFIYKFKKYYKNNVLLKETEKQLVFCQCQNIRTFLWYVASRSPENAGYYGVGFEDTGVAHKTHHDVIKIRVNPTLISKVQTKVKSFASQFHQELNEKCKKQCFGK